MSAPAASAATAATVVTKVPRIPPSNFAVLLRRSKFASYDPQIGQIYTTYDGSAHRGDWGLKRPLSVRRRDGRLIINSVDTLYQQTEWTSAYSDANVVRKFEEIGVTPQPDRKGEWIRRFRMDNTSSQPEDGTRRPMKWMHDSDYARAKPEDVKLDIKTYPPVPNPDSMKPKRFERYLRRLRRLVPEFQEYVEKRKTVDARLSRHHEQFLGAKFLESCKENPNFIHPMPHPTGGLAYNNMNELQSAVSAKPIPGRRIYLEKQTTNTLRGKMNVALGGWVGREHITLKEGAKGKECPVPLTDAGTKGGEPRRDPDAGKDVFRPLSMGCFLYSAPNVVGKYPQRIQRAVLKMQVVSWSDADKARSNPHKPGTVEYVKHKERQQNPQQARPVVPYTDRPRSSFAAYKQLQRTPPKDDAIPSALLNTLQDTIWKTPRPDPKNK
ncbi:hypothetical protein A7U60_g4798 [Sanghuangporus baumii]|uniref:Uncharacterized protein n=1 Tax=Sanghuangporus baumii TaxID=108892 RepID=A0A9Q5HXU6_SANBA|nr:hypothetical protein A7U60_g4798 [Sanghuangporus baumii]